MLKKKNTVHDKMLIIMSLSKCQCDKYDTLKWIDQNT